LHAQDDVVLMVAVEQSGRRYPLGAIGNLTIYQNFVMMFIKMDFPLWSPWICKLINRQTTDIMSDERDILVDRFKDRPYQRWALLDVRSF